MAAPQWSGPHAKAKTVQEAKALFRHNDKDRREEANHTNFHIDKSKTKDNFTYRGLDYAGLCKVFDDKLASVDMGRESSGRNARTLLQSVILYPPAALPRDKERDWFMDAGRVLEAQFGDNLLEIQFDMDEEHWYTDKETKEKRLSRNHGHARLFPEVGGKLNGKEFSSRAVIKRLNAELDRMSVKLYGVPMMDGTKKKGGVTVETLKVNSLRVEVEQLQEQADTLITDALDAATEIRRAARQDAKEIRQEADQERDQAKRERTAAWMDAQDAQAEKEDAEEYARQTRHQADEDAKQTRDQAAQDAHATRGAADQYAARVRQEADRAAQAAQKEIQEKKEAAEREAKETRQKARMEARTLKQAGYEDGYAEGEKAAQEAVKREIEASKRQGYLDGYEIGAREGASTSRGKLAEMRKQAGVQSAGHDGHGGLGD